MRSLVLFVLLTIFSCGNAINQKEDNQIDLTHLDTDVRYKDLDDTIYLDIKGEEYKHLVQISDSLRTPEQEKLFQLIGEVIVNYMAVENNHQVLKLSKEEFIAKGIPERYYILLEENIRDNNAFFDSEGIKDVDKMIEEMKDDFRSLYEPKKQ
jgi:hypothetical protein